VGKAGKGMAETPFPREHDILDWRDRDQEEIIIHYLQIIVSEMFYQK